MMKFVVLVLLAMKINIALSQCLPNYSSPYDAIDAIDNFMFPLDKFNPECMMKDCPSLLDLPCPFNSNRSINNDVCTQILSNLQSCISKGGSLCSTPIDPIPLCPVGFSLDQLLSPTNIIGTLEVVPGVSNMTGLSGISMTYEPTPSYVQISIPRLLYQAQVQGSAGIKGWNQNFNINSGPATSRLNVSLILFIQNQGGQNQQPNVTIQVTGKTITAVDEFGQLLNQNPGNNQMSLLSIFLDLATQTVIQNSNEPTDLGRFVGAMISNAVKAVAQKCTNNSD